MIPDRRTLAPTQRKLLLLALLASVLDLYFYSGFYMSDDVSYLEGIQRIVSGRTIDVNDLAHTRLAVTLPAALSYAITGSISLTILSFCLYHPILVLLAYAAGKLAFGERIALYGAALVALSPTYYFFAGAILPDNCLTLWLATALVIALYVDDARARGALGRGRERMAWAVAGLLTGVAYSAKEPALVLTAVLGVVAASRAGRDGVVHAMSCAASYGAGLMAFLAGEVLALRLLSGQWVVRLLAGVGSVASAAALEERAGRQGWLPWDRIAFWYHAATPYHGVGLVLVFILAANVAAPFLVRREQRRPLWILLAFWIWLFVYLTFGSARLDRYLPPPIQHARYYAPCAFAALLVLAASLVGAADGAARRLGAARPRLGRWCHHAPTVVVAALAVLMFARIERRAGAVYRAHQTKSALLAFGAARRLHPDLPIVLSDYLSKRLAPLVAVAKTPPLSAPSDNASLPARPFSFLRASPPFEASSFGAILDRLKDENAIEIVPDGEKIYLAPYGRRAEIAAATSSLRSALEDPKRTTQNPNDAIELFLVRDP
jgi:4-amino-4-deoxy-L-arabinose transferase-like glycosyltransferase